jgi:hypothetical protein
MSDFLSKARVIVQDLRSKGKRQSRGVRWWIQAHNFQQVLLDNLKNRAKRVSLYIDSTLCDESELTSLFVTFRNKAVSDGLTLEHVSPYPLLHISLTNKELRALYISHWTGQTCLPDWSKEYDELIQTLSQYVTLAIVQNVLVEFL